MTFKKFELSKEIYKSDRKLFKYGLAETEGTFDYSYALKNLFDGVKVINTGELEYWEKFGKNENNLMFTNSTEST